VLRLDRKPLRHHLLHRGSCCRHRHPYRRRRHRCLPRPRPMWVRRWLERLWCPGVQLSGSPAGWPNCEPIGRSCSLRTRCHPSHRRSRQAGSAYLESSCAYVARAHRPHRKKEREGGTTSQKRKGAKPGHTELRGRSDCYVPRLWLSEVTRRGRGARGDRRNPREYAMLVSLNPRGAPPAP